MLLNKCEDSFRFNRLMHESLKTYVYTTDDAYKYALKQSVLTTLLDYYDHGLLGTETVGKQGGIFEQLSKVYARRFDRALLYL